MKRKLLLNLDHIFYYLQNFQKKSEFILYQPIKLYFINLEGKLLLINLFERFPFIWYSSLARLWMFLWWIMENDFFEAVHEMNLCCHYIQFVVSDWCFYSIIYHETFKLVGSSQTVANSPLCVRVMQLDNLAKTDNFVPAFLHKFETYLLKDNVLSISIPNSFFC